jgi:NADPH:quinone reductase
MRAAILKAFGDPATSLVVGEMETPVPKPGQVLVKVEAATVNPADAAFVVGHYAKKPLPTVPGLEGAGTMVANNAGLYGRWLMGKRVAFTAPADGPGTWAEYMVCAASACVPLKAHVTTEMGAALLVNPLTAVNLLDHARAAGSKAIVQTAAGSALGRMIFRLGAKRGVPSINIVRRAEAAEKLRTEGREHVLDSSADGFEAALRDLCFRLGATMAFDAVAGDMSALLARSMPHGGKVLVYGGLSGQDAKLGIGDAILNAKAIEGYWIPLKIKAMGPLRLLRMVSTIQRHMPGIFGTEILERVPLERVHDALTLLQTRGSEGKVLLIP